MSEQRALIVEDQPAWQTILTATLHSMGWISDIANTYPQALSQLDLQDYQLAIIDPMLSNSPASASEGLLALQEIHGRYPDLQLIVISGTMSKASLLHDLPPATPFIAKQEWDKDAFKGLVMQARIDPSDTIGRRTIVRLLREALIYQPPSDETMPIPPNEPDGRGPRVLVVEAQQEWQVILAQALHTEGWFWRVVPHADAARRILETQHFHIVLLDLRLGDEEDSLQEGTSWRLLDHLAAQDQRVQVIIVSGEATRGDVATLFTRYPIVGFIDKDTFKKNELLGLIYSATAMPKIRVQTLGGFALYRNNELLDDFGDAQAETLLKILVSAHGQTFTTAQLRKWLECEDDAALLALVNTVRLLLQPDLLYPADSAFILENSAGFLLDTGQNISLDFDELDQLLYRGKTLQAQGKSADAKAIYKQAQGLYAGEFLPTNQIEEWAIPVRNYTQRQIARVLNRLADLYANEGDFRQAISTAQISLKIDSYHESTHRRLMRYHHCNNNPQAALTVYATLTKMMSEFFGEHPSQQTQALRDSIAAGESIACTEQ